MRPMTLSDIVALVVGQVVAIVTTCLSISCAWHWLVVEHPFK